jgi:hypothetical protein
LKSLQWLEGYHYFAGTREDDPLRTILHIAYVERISALGIRYPEEALGIGDGALRSQLDHRPW